MAKQVWFFVLSAIILLLSLFLACNAENNLFNLFIVVVGGVAFVALQALVFMVLPSFKSEK